MSKTLLRVGLIPTPHDDQVRQALNAAAAATGWTMTETAPVGRVRKPTVVLSAWTPWMMAPAQLVADVILSPDPAGSVLWAETQGLAAPPHSITLATDWLATAAAMGPATRVFGPTHLAVGVQLADTLSLPPIDVSREAPVDDASAALAIALTLFAGGRPEAGSQADWPVRLIQGPLGEALPGHWTSITGPGRTLAYGPFICLPPGQWRLRLEFEMDEEAAQLHWTFDWGSGDSYVSLNVTPGRAGRFVAVLDRAWQASAPSQARMVLTESALVGRARLVSVSVERIG
jgi:hypothetical protein